MARATVSRASAVLYLRRSTDKQERSIEDQRSELVRHAATKGYSIVGEYVDEGVSGDQTEKRLDFLRMREDAIAGKFAIILSWDLDRFGRFDPVEAGFWIHPVRSAGVRLETVAQGSIDWDDFAGRISYFIQQEAKHSFLKDLSRNVCRAQLAMAREGKGTGGNRVPFGYRALKVRDERGKLVESKLAIEPEHAEIVRRIFRLYLEAGGSLRSVANRLNEEKVPTPAELQGLRLQTARKWNITTLRGIITNKKLTGAFVWGVQGVGSYHTTCTGEIVARRKSDKKAKGTPIVHEHKHEAIVDQETFDRVQALLHRRRRLTIPKGSNQFVLTGLLRCGDCGGPMGGYRWGKGKGIYGYTCRRYSYSGKAGCFCNAIKEAPLVDAIVRLIRDEYLSPTALDRLRQAIQEEQARGREPDASKKAAAISRRIEELNRIIDRGAERVLSVPAELVPVLAAKLEEHRKERDRLSLEARRLEGSQERPDLPDEQEVAKALEALRDLRGALAKAGPVETRELLSSLVDRVELSFDHRQSGKLTRNKFRSGIIYFRPDAGGSVLFAKGPPSEQERTLRFTLADLKSRAA